MAVYQVRGTFDLPADLAQGIVVQVQDQTGQPARLHYEKVEVVNQGGESIAVDFFTTDDNGIPSASSFFGNKPNPGSSTFVPVPPPTDREGGDGTFWSIKVGASNAGHSQRMKGFFVITLKQANPRVRFRAGAGSMITHAGVVDGEIEVVDIVTG